MEEDCESRKDYQSFWSSGAGIRDAGSEYSGYLPGWRFGADR